MSPRDQSDSFAGLPEILREIAEVAGLEAALQLAREHGGTEIGIPRKVGPDHWLTRCVGAKAADKICDHFSVRDADGHAVGGFRVYLPLADAGLMPRTIAQLAQALETENLSVREAVRRFGVCDRTVKRVLAKLRDDRQHRLPLAPPRDGSHPQGRLAPMRNIGPTNSGIFPAASDPEPAHADPRHPDRPPAARLRPRPGQG